MLDNFHQKYRLSSSFADDKVHDMGDTQGSRHSPDEPVKNTFLPLLARLRICRCSSDSIIVDFHDERFTSSGPLGSGLKSSADGSTRSSTSGSVFESGGGS